MLLIETLASPVAASNLEMIPIVSQNRKAPTCEQKGGGGRVETRDDSDEAIVTRTTPAGTALVLYEQIASY